MTRTRKPPAKPTWDMTARELAMVVADHQGWRQDGGWLTANDRTDCPNCGGEGCSIEGGPCPACGGSGQERFRVPIAHGWDELAAVLVDAGIIAEGSGVNWPWLATIRPTHLRYRRLRLARIAREGRR